MKEFLSGLTAIVLVIAFIVFFPYGMTTIKSTDNGVRSDWGQIQEQSLGAGLRFYNPIRTDIKKIDMRERTATINTTTTSKEGLKFGIGVTARYRVKEGQAVYLVRNLSTELSTLISSYANATIDDIATGRSKNEMYSDTGRIEIVRAVKEKLNAELADYADVTQIILEDITLPKSITIAIEAQQAEFEKIKTRENAKLVAEKDADIRVIEANGIAEANRIISNSLTSNYLQYEAIKNMNPNATKIYIPAKGGMVPTIGY